MKQTISLTISGKVQGVFFRQSTREKAQELSITGFVKNKPDGTVYILASGEKEPLEEFISWCRQGPPKAQVANVLVGEESPQAFMGFTIVRN